MEEAEQAEGSPRAPVVHLVVLAHGNRGSPQDWLAVRQVLQREAPEWHIMVSHANEKRTTEGIRAGGQRLAHEIVQFIQNQVVTVVADGGRGGGDGLTLHFSILGHSLGGLFARACLPALFRACEEASITLVPLSYMSFSTPHLGSRRPGGSIAKAIWKACVHGALSSPMYSQTGKDLLMEDSATMEEKILVQMSDPGSEYMRCLSLFRTRTLFSIAHHDLAVPYTSSAIRTVNPYPEPKARDTLLSILASSQFDVTYVDHLRKSVEEGKITMENAYECNDDPPGQPEAQYCFDNVRHLEYSPDMVANLQTLSWRRFDVLFGGARGPHIHDMWLHKTKIPSWLNPFDLASSLVFIDLLAKLLGSDVDSAINGQPAVKDDTEAKETLIVETQ